MEKEIIHILPAKVIGGAELMTFKMVRHLNTSGIRSKILYLKNTQGQELESFEDSLGLESYKDINSIVRLSEWFSLKKYTALNTLIHSHLPWSLYFCSPIIKEHEIKAVHTVHNSQDFFFSFPFQNRINSYLLNRLDAVIGISNAVTDRIKSIKLSNPVVKTIYNGANLSIAQERKPFGKLKLVSVGTLKKQKGYDFALHFLAKNKDYIDSFTLVGNGIEFDSLKNKCRELGLSQIVNIVGFSDSPEKYLYASDLYLQPSRWEGFGLAALEALSTGMPIIASDVAGMDEVLGNDNPGVKLLKFGDIKIWADAIEDAFNNPSFYKDAYHHNPKQASKFDFESMVKNYIELYRTLD